MLIIAALVLIAYGYSQIAHKDFWWWDKQLLSDYFGVAVTRTAAWERQQDLWGRAWIAVGLGLLVYALSAVVI